MENEVVNKVQPNDTLAEQAVLGSMLVSKDAVQTAIEVLKPDVKNKSSREKKLENKQSRQKNDDEYLEVLRKYSSNHSNRDSNKKRRKGGR